MSLNIFHISSDSTFTLYNGDSVDVCANLPEKSVDCVFADPPYFLSKGFSIKTKSGYVREFDKGDWDKVRSKEEVHEQPCEEAPANEVIAEEEQPLEEEIPPVNEIEELEQELAKIEQELKEIRSKRKNEN